MSQYELTPQGVEDFLVDLYAKSDEFVAAVSEQINSDLRGFVINNFDIASDQISFLGSLNTSFINYCEAQCAICILHRMPIRFVYPTTMDIGYKKWIATHNDLKMESSHNARLRVEGSFTFEIFYLDESQRPGAWGISRIS